MVQSFILSIISSYVSSLHYPGDSSSSSESSSAAIGGAIGGALAVIVIIALVPILILCIRKSQKKKGYSISSEGHDDMIYNSKLCVAFLYLCSLIMNVYVAVTISCIAILINSYTRSNVSFCCTLYVRMYLYVCGASVNLNPVNGRHLYKSTGHYSYMVLLWIR